MKENLVKLLFNFLKQENYHINYDELKLQLLSHPSYPSLHSLTGVLNHFNIENLALEVPTDKDTLNQLPNIFITLTSNEDSKEFCLVTKLNNAIEIYYDKKNRNKIGFDEFIQNWSGIILVIDERNESVNEKPSKLYNSNLFEYGLAIVIIGLFFFKTPSLSNSLHFIFSLVGFGISILIVKHELGLNSKFVEQLCNARESTNCDAVLNSKGASIFKQVKLSDVCLIYFSSLILFWLISKGLDISYQSIMVVSLITIPVTFYSIYYQFNVVKKWCPLCLGVVGVLWLQFASIMIFDYQLVNSSFNFTSSIVLILSFFTSITIWKNTRPLLKKNKELEKLEIEHFKFKRNFDLFDSVYSKNDYIETNIDNKKEIILGNKNALLNILLVTNPACYYCKSAHFDIEKIISQHSKNLKVTIRFNVPQNTDNISHQVASRLIELYYNKHIDDFKMAINEAYSDKSDLKKWISKWGKSKSELAIDLLNQQKEWCNKNNLNFTPALLVNGRQFPKEYNRSDLNYFIDDLIEQAELKEKPREMELVNN
ncbi:vitamin K epoxide reductase family protein [Abyssalbus ytuae]|uniref:Thioredoxin domain-containing protein n=1 Tax=Abyssalbus ytuae TaxID=2926907 RepID=A0A9E6ZVT1_9FLAO|nr:vitamin K epoxide reductase family protein [Abyssalbus ytuae]UOB17716.1 thioredoxin domain-containing protein [Abyssalbus ytuae]